MKPHPGCLTETMTFYLPPASAVKASATLPNTSISTHSIISEPCRPHVTTYKSILILSTCCFPLIFSNLLTSIVTFAGLKVYIDQVMKPFAGLCVSAIPRNAQVQSPVRLLRLPHGTRRGIATGGHYVVPKPFNEPNVSLCRASPTAAGH